MAASLAHDLLRQGLIDLVLCLAPSCQVVESFKQTFDLVLNRSLDGVLGSVGVAQTYQALSHCNEQFWKLFDRYRIFVVFDEIHHCAGSDPQFSNLWGRQVLQKIKDKAQFTLLLSGTPWRSDDLPISVARYSGNKRLIVDFHYGLRQAVYDGVCRAPRIVMLDNDEVTITEESDKLKSERRFDSIQSLLDGSPVTYPQLLNHEDVVQTLLALGSAKLSELREGQPNAAGLIVASSIMHANLLGEALEAIGEDYQIVTVQSPCAQKEINEFRVSNRRWIISVGMISEGTDIPRLRVCCYLSRIRTELYFRQVLGRVLRRSGCADDQAWLYMLAEPDLMEFAMRVADDLPEDLAVLKKIGIPLNSVTLEAALTEKPFSSNQAEPQARLMSGLTKETGSQATAMNLSNRTFEVIFSPDYRSQLLAVF